MNANAKSNHCTVFTRSPNSWVARRTVKIGEMYWIVVALANGMCLMVTKKRKRADIPANPLITSHFLLFPQKGSLRWRIQTMQIERDMIDRKKTISCVGMSSRYLTQKFTTAYASDERSMYAIPLYCKLRSYLFIFSLENRPSLEAVSGLIIVTLQQHG